MIETMGGVQQGHPTDAKQAKKYSFRMPIATKLIASFVFIILTSNLIFLVMGIRLIIDRIVTEAQERVRTDLNSAREIYNSELGNIYDVIRLTANRPVVQNAILSGDTLEAQSVLGTLKEQEGMDILSLTDKTGKVIFRANSTNNIGDDQSQDEVIKAALERKVPVMRTSIESSENLARESDLLAQKAYFKFIDTPKARPKAETEETSGMVLKAAAPVFNSDRSLIGVLYGGVLLNRNYNIVDRIKHTVFQGVKYENKDIGTATIFQDDVRISTNVMNEDGSRAIGTRVAEDVYNQVVLNAKPWTCRAYVVNDWYITAYEPIRDINNEVIGILYVGILEQKFLDIRNRTILAFVTVSFFGILVSVIIAYFISRSISGPVSKLVVASKELANGNLDVKVETSSTDELGELAEAYNVMATALRERDEQLKEFTRKKLIESERLALIGQLAANVAHELNNPLQGIVTYSHLVLEQDQFDERSRSNIQKIVTQAVRCRDIIRGLLDFSRQRKPDKILTDINNLLQECVALIEKQALFHNIELILDLDENLPMSVIDPSQVERVFINLIVNAAEAMDGVGQLRMSTHITPDRQSINIVFTDTGHGISEENLEKIFDPFFTTKETGHGVGLGLAISYGIIKEHKGIILVESELEKGTTFTVRLPILTEIPGENNGADT